MVYVKAADIKQYSSVGMFISDTLPQYHEIIIQIQGKFREEAQGVNPSSY